MQRTADDEMFLGTKVKSGDSEFKYNKIGFSKILSQNDLSKYLIVNSLENKKPCIFQKLSAFMDKKNTLALYDRDGLK